MLAFLIFVTVVFVLVYRGSTPEERTRFGQAALHVLRRLRQLITLRHKALRVTPVTPILIAANITIFVLIQFTPHSLSDPNTLIGWGGNFGPRTANGEWWRLVTALFVHAGWLHLLANLVGLLQLGL